MSEVGLSEVLMGSRCITYSRWLSTLPSLEKLRAAQKRSSALLWRELEVGLLWYNRCYMVRANKITPLSLLMAIIKGKLNKAEKSQLDWIHSFIFNNWIQISSWENQGQGWNTPWMGCQAIIVLDSIQFNFISNKFNSFNLNNIYLLSTQHQFTALQWVSQKHRSTNIIVKW